MTDDTDDIQKKSRDHRDKAEALLKSLDEISVRDCLSENPVVNARYYDATGLLSGIAQGTIRTGQPRIIEQLIRIVENYPEGKNTFDIIDAIAACSEYGLSAEGHTFPGTYRASLIGDR